jgi:hypothetical protein
LVTALINWRRKDEGLKLAEERAQPDEEAHLDDIIATFTDQMRRLLRAGREHQDAWGGAGRIHRS